MCICVSVNIHDISSLCYSLSYSGRPAAITARSHVLLGAHKAGATLLWPPAAAISSSLLPCWRHLKRLHDASRWSTEMAEFVLILCSDRQEHDLAAPSSQDEVVSALSPRCASILRLPTRLQQFWQLGSFVFNAIPSIVAVSAINTHLLHSICFESHFQVASSLAFQPTKTVTCLAFLSFYICPIQPLSKHRPSHHCLQSKLEPQHGVVLRQARSLGETHAGKYRPKWSRIA